MRFCFNKHLNLSLFKNESLKYLKYYNRELLEELETNIIKKEQIKKEQIKFDIIKIVEMIKDNPNNFDLIDICLNTNYDILELIKESDNVLNREDSILLRKIIRNLRTYKFFTKNDINNIINSTFIFNINGELIKMLPDDIKTVLDFLIDNNIPLCSETLKNSCIKLYQKRLFPNKTK